MAYKISWYYIPISIIIVFLMFIFNNPHCGLLRFVHKFYLHVTFVNAHIKDYHASM